MIEISSISRKENLSNLATDAAKVLHRCEVPDEFIGWLTVAVKDHQISTYDAIKLALKMGPDVMQIFSELDWE